MTTLTEEQVHEIRIASWYDETQLFIRHQLKPITEPLSKAFMRAQDDSPHDFYMGH